MDFKTNQEIQGEAASDSRMPTILSVSQSIPKSRTKLTGREIEMLRYVAAGYTSDMIGRNLYISTLTVDSHRKNIIKKLGVTNLTAAVAYALRNNLIQ